MKLFRIFFGAICLVTASSAFAEVADKEPTLGRVWAWAIGIILAAFLLARIRPILGIIVLPIGALFAFAGYSELTDPYVGPAIRDELGLGYVAASYLAYALAVLGPIAIVYLSAKHRRRRANGSGVHSA